MNRVAEELMSSDAIFLGKDTQSKINGTDADSDGNKFRRRDANIYV